MYHYPSHATRPQPPQPRTYLYATPPPSRWPDTARYAPGYTTAYDPHPRDPLYNLPNQTFCRQQTYAPRPHPHLPPGPRQWHKEPRHVHFDLPLHTSKRHLEKKSSDQHLQRKRSGLAPRPATPGQPHLPRKPSLRNLRHEARQPPPPPPQFLDPNSSSNSNREPSQPTIYILTFSEDIIRTRLAHTHLLSSHLPHRTPPIPHLYTISLAHTSTPPAHLCAHYSGVSPIIQDHVLRDPRAQKAVRRAVDELLEFGRREKRKANREGWGGGREQGRREVALSVSCVMGTHRSVAVAERIGEEVRREVRRLGLRDGVRVVIRHVHRVRGRGDPY